MSQLTAPKITKLKVETDLSALYAYRFQENERAMKTRLWKTLCAGFFQNLIGEDKVILDVACGYGEFINNIHAARKIAVDLNPDAVDFLDSEIDYLQSPATAIPLLDNRVDVAFTSNFLEHLKSKEECNLVFAEIKRVLKPSGRFIIMGPNIRYLSKQYWDFYDHHLPLSHLSLREGLIQAGYEVDRIIPRFLPYTVKSKLPRNTGLVALYLKLPIAWPILGKQFLAIARKPN